jgi:hypothetical protein
MRRRRGKMRSMTMYSFYDNIWFGKYREKQPICSMKEVSVCLGNEKEDGKKREDKKNGHVQLL